MRILIVDDDPKKVSTVRSFLIEEGVNDSDILIAEHAAGARKALAQSYVDVLLIDVLLPARKNELPKGENSLELLKQIVEDETTPAPSYIFGITASSEAVTAFDEQFRNLVTQLLHIAPGHDTWREALQARLKLMRRTDADEPNDYDICILNALRAPELEAVYATWPLNLGSEFLLQRNILCKTGTVTLSGVERRIVCSHLSQMGPIASAHAATALLSEFRPRTLVMTGICGGFADHVKVGDVVVAEKSWDWQSGKWTDDGALSTAPDQRNASPELIAEARGAGGVLSTFHTACTLAKKPSTAPKLVIGPMVTGSSVVASLDIQKVFRDQHRKMVGIDMECYGLYYAAENHAGAPVRTLCIKAVSDLADRAKDDDFQVYGSHMSAQLALEVLTQFFTK